MAIYETLYVVPVWDNGDTGEAFCVSCAPKHWNGKCTCCTTWYSDSAEFITLAYSIDYKSGVLFCAACDNLIGIPLEEMHNPTEFLTCMVEFLSSGMYTNRQRTQIRLYYFATDTTGISFCCRQPIFLAESNGAMSSVCSACYGSTRPALDIRK